MRFAIEISSWFWHKQKTKRKNDLRKISLCKEKDIRLVVVMFSVKNDVDLSDMSVEMYRFEDDLTHSNEGLLKQLTLDLLADAGVHGFVPDWDAAWLYAGRWDGTMETSEFREKVESMYPDIEVLGEYVAAHKHILCRCKVCGMEWAPQATKLLHDRAHCPFCSGRRTPQEKFQELVQEVLPNVRIIGTYKRQTAPVVSKCVTCGHVWSAWPLKLLEGVGCVYCNQESRQDKPVVCLEKKTRYPSVAAARRDCGVHYNQGIKDACQNPDRTSGGFHWRWYSPEYKDYLDKTEGQNVPSGA